MPAAQSAHSGSTQDTRAARRLHPRYRTPYRKVLLPEPSQQHSSFPSELLLYQRDGEDGLRTGRAPPRSPTPAAPGAPGAPGRGWGRVGGSGGLAGLVGRGASGAGSDGWVPYGLPQLLLIVQLALQAARALLRGVRLLLQAPNLPPHRLQRAAAGHGAGQRRSGCGGRGRLLHSGRRCRTPERRPPRPGLAARRRRPLRSTTSPEVAVSWAAQANHRRVRRAPGAGTAGGAGCAPRAPAICKPREALRMLAKAGWRAWWARCGGTWPARPGGEGGHCARGSTATPNVLPWLFGGLG